MQASLLNFIHTMDHQWWNHRGGGRDVVSKSALQKKMYLINDNSRNYKAEMVLNLKNVYPANIPLKQTCEHSQSAVASINPNGDISGVFLDILRCWFFNCEWLPA